MTDNRLRTAIGLFWVASQFAIVLIILVLYVLKAFEPEDFKSLLEIILPMFSGVGVVVIRYFAKHRHDTDAGETLNLPYVVLTWSLSGVFTSIVAGSIILRAMNLAFSDVEDLKLFLAIVQSLYVGYIAILFAPLFDASEGSMTPSTSTEG